MGIPFNFDPLGSGNSDPYKRGQVLGEIANPQDAASQWFYVDVPKPGVYKLWLVGGGNTTNWCYIGCNYPGSAAGFIGKMYFYIKCHLRVGVGLQDQPSRFQVASWEDPNTWYDLVVCEAGVDASGGAGRGGYITVNRESTFNNYFDIELETNGNHGSNGGWTASVYDGYGTKDINGYGKLQYERMKMTYYAKLANGRLKYAPINLETETDVIFNYGLEINAHQLLSDGYKPVELIEDKSKYSDCEGEYTFEFEEKNDKIIEVAKYHRYSDEVLNEKIRQNRLNAYRNNTDQLTLRKLRKQAIGAWTEADEAEYVEMVKKMSSDINTGNPYIDNKEKISDNELLSI